MSQEFGWRSGNPILTGSIYLDWAGAGMYEPGEGYGGVTIQAVGLNGQGIFQTSTWSTGGYSLPLPPGSYAVTASGGGIPAPLSKISHSQDRQRLLGIRLQDRRRRSASPGSIFRQRADRGSSLSGVDRLVVRRRALAADRVRGAGTDVPEPSDYDGVGRTEIAVYRPSTSQWFVLGPNGVGRQLARFGGPGMDVPEPGDYDGLGRTEVAVYRPSTGNGS